jgi:hypothetical protein
MGCALGWNPGKLGSAQNSATAKQTSLQKSQVGIEWAQRAKETQRRALKKVDAARPT